MSTKQTNATEAFQTITDKRKALESLINIATGIESQQGALSELALAARPSQNFPPKLINYFKALEKSLKDQDSTNLLQKLEKVEEAISKSVKKILMLASIDVNKLRNNEIENVDVTAFRKFVDEFKRKTNTSLGLRLVLKKRGLAIAPIQIPIKQEVINQQIDALKEKEKKCIKQVRSEIQAIIKDTQSMLKMDGLPDQMKTELESVNKAMQVNIEHLDQGGSISTIPNVFETVVLESNLPQEPTEKPADDSREEDNESAQQTSEESETAKKPSAPYIAPSQTPKSNWWIFKKWLSSPWKTSWRSLKEKYGK